MYSKSSADFGVALSFVGATLDFVSGYLIMGQQSGTGMMNVGPLSTTALYAIGVLLSITGIIGLTFKAMTKMQVFGGVMIVFGFVMLGLGWLMLSANLTLASGFYGVGMLLTGGLMVVNALRGLNARAKAQQM